MFSYPLPDGRLRIRYGEPIVAVRRGTLSEDIHAITQQCTRILEREIREHPECWMWMHNRWRTRPTAAPPAGAATAAAPELAAPPRPAAGRASTHP